MLRKFLPKFLTNELFGDRERYGRRPPEGDPDWERWLSLYPTILQETQKQSFLANRVNEAGYTILSKHRLDGLNICEIGPGHGTHLEHFCGNPAQYTVFDVCEDFFSHLQQECIDRDFQFKAHLVQPYEPKLPVESESQDIFLSFYSMEHLEPFGPWLHEILRTIKPGGLFLGAVPAEGSIAWGLGRWLTTKNALKKQFQLDIRKIVCWEHPNFCDEMMQTISQHPHNRLDIEAWPLRNMPYDLSLILKFTVKKAERAAGMDC